MSFKKCYKIKILLCVSPWQHVPRKLGKNWHCYQPPGKRAVVSIRGRGPSELGLPADAPHSKQLRDTNNTLSITCLSHFAVCWLQGSYVIV